MTAHDHSEPVLSVRDLSRTYSTKTGQTVGLLGVSFDLAAGERLALLGPNGSGKSTLLSLISTAVEPEAGEARLAGATLSRGSSAAERRRARAALGVVFQSPALDRLLTVRENLRAAAALLGLGRAEAAHAVDSALEEMELAGRAHDRVGKLSGGLARRADLARALLGSPRLIILDEPTTGLDPDARRGLLAALDRLRSREPAPAVLHTTHLTDEAEGADRVAFMDRGRLAALDAPGALRARVGERAVAVSSGSHGAENLLRGLGLEPRAMPGGRLLAALNGVPAARVAEALDARGLSFTIGPPSLDDAYAAIVGRSLDEAVTGAAEPEPAAAEVAP